MEQNQQIRQHIYELAAGLNDRQLNVRLDPGQWSIAQVLDHLYLMERTIAHKFGETLKQGQSAPTSIKPYHLTLDRTRRIQAPPHMIPTEEPRSFGQLKEQLEQSRASLIQVLEGHTDDQLTQLSFPHPVFGLMDLKQWREFLGMHEQRHMEQMRDIRQALISQS
ncbi:DinB family protein [Paenibacillus sp. YPG26]|uniref:DinB family protein n=1 Tax=Paenibacillus sp. YPG26 TaxID=2878915 RepID=UPI00203A492E|nr:DinB family protein [Paenibacillus sp. YPG26]USB34147.1 DinB family protein [Paenibacillus sp. YPG26]